MFPYTEADDVEVIIPFMAALGATEHQTAISAQYIERATRFLVPGFPRHPVAHWKHDAFSRPYFRYDAWTEALGRHVKGSLINEPTLRQNHKMFDLLDRLARTLIEEGYQRDITAVTMLLFAHRSIQGNHPGAGSVIETVQRCADIHLLHRLAPIDQLDCATRDIPLTHLEDLLDQDVPYVLIKDMYPAGM